VAVYNIIEESIPLLNKGFSETVWLRTSFVFEHDMHAIFTSFEKNLMCSRDHRCFKEIFARRKQKKIFNFFSLFAFFGVKKLFCVWILPSLSIVLKPAYNSKFFYNNLRMLRGKIYNNHVIIS
jgi:hypothetical protein